MSEQKKSSAGLNADAKEFSFSPTASEWKPGSIESRDEDVGGEELTAMRDEEEQEGDTPITENEPLWKATLKIVGGDRAAAVKMLEDPDSLMAHPEIVKIIESTTQEEEKELIEEWERAEEDDQVMKQLEASMGKVEVEKDAPLIKKEGEESVPSHPRSSSPAGERNENEDEVVDVSMEEEAVDADSREHLSLVFIGHVDAGKSTLAGNLLYVTNFVDKRTIERYEREAKQRNRESWYLAFIMDTNEEERAKGKTVEVGRARFSTDLKRYTILDAPGHNAYVPNMIQGAAQADVAVLVVSARRGEFETGFLRNGQTREHALLSQALGVSYLVVLVNKMDEPTVKWSKQRFDDIVKEVKPFLNKQCGFKVKTQVRFIPVSGLSAANIKDEVPRNVCPWWHKMVAEGANNTTEATFLNLLDSLHIQRDSEKPLRCPVLDRYVERGALSIAKVEQGTIRSGQRVLIMPTRLSAKVEGILIDEKWVSMAKAGEMVVLRVSCSDNDVAKGYVICDEVQPCMRTTAARCQLKINDLPETRPIFTRGFEAIFHAHTMEVECAVVDLWELSKEKGRGRRIRYCNKNVNSVVIAVLRFSKSVALEKYADNSSLGRFALRSEGLTIAVGQVMDIRHDETGRG
eukprot:101652_1